MVSFKIDRFTENYSADNYNIRCECSTIRNVFHSKVIISLWFRFPSLHRMWGILVPWSGRWQLLSCRNEAPRCFYLRLWREIQIGDICSTYTFSRYFAVYHKSVSNCFKRMYRKITNYSFENFPLDKEKYKYDRKK